jgi:large repetitive protein
MKVGKSIRSLEKGLSLSLMLLVVFPVVSWGAEDAVIARIGSGIWSSPAVAPDGTIYVGSSDTNLYAVNGAGDIKWAFKTGGPVWSSPAVGDDGTIYVGSSDNSLYAVNPDDGSKKWAFPTSGPVMSSPAIGFDGTDHILYVGSNDGNLYAVKASDGSAKWSVPFSTGGPVSSSPELEADPYGFTTTILVGSGDGNLYAVNADGTKRWAFPTGAPRPNFAGLPRTGGAPLRVVFTDLSIGIVTSRTWDFGDGTVQKTSRRVITHTYLETGVYTVKLSVSGPGGRNVSKTKKDYITVRNIPPVVAFGIEQGTLPHEVRFINRSRGTIESYEWTFGDESGTVTEKDPIHIYDQSGRYAVTLTASGPAGEDSQTKTILVIW